MNSLIKLKKTIKGLAVIPLQSKRSPHIQLGKTLFTCKNDFIDEVELWLERKICEHFLSWCVYKIIALWKSKIPI